MADEALVHANCALKKQTNEVGHMNAAKKQSNFQIGSRPLRNGPVRSGPVRSGTVRGPVRSGTVRSTVRNRQPTVVGIE